MKDDRYNNALAIQEGACNPSGILNSMLSACREIRDNPDHTGTDELRADPALRLMAHQLSYLLRVAEIDNDLQVYGDLVAQCKARTEG
jgi:hypothetical protein